MLLVASLSIKGKSSMLPSFKAIILKITSARFALKISGGVKKVRDKKSCSGYNLIQIPFSTRPHLPFLWSALLLDIATTGREVVLDLGV
jgi:hypothetical protein